jgi:eukaryotic-like serine/threonine-protein kinase
MGEEYRAKDARLNRDVAIKVLPESFTREAHVLASLSYPNIAAIYGIEEQASCSAGAHRRGHVQRTARTLLA